MAITTASVEANGWVLRITLTGSTGSFASYALDPDGIPRVSLACTHPGFALAGGIAVATPCARTLVATKPLRKPVNPASPTQFLIDETDHGDGTVTVRLALSEYVHATETGVTLSVAAGWRTGEAAASGIAVTNASTFAAPLPIFRWARLGYRRETGSFDLDLVVFSHHPQSLAPVAGVRFSVTDGTTVKTAWATALSTSTAYGDSLRCYRVTIDPATATALTAGLLRCDAEVYPWLGAMRSTDPAGARSMTGLATAGYDDGAQRPHVVGYDPAGTRYAGQYLFVDPAGTTTASAAMVQASRATAKALATGARPANLTTAIQALYLANRSLAAANGGAAASRATDGAVITLAAGTHVPGASAVTSGITASELPVIVEGDPDDPAPRTNCILQTQASGPNVRVMRVEYRNLRLEIGGAALLSSTATYCTLDNVEVRGKAGSEASSVAAFLGSVAGKLPLNAVRSRWWRSGSAFGGSTQKIGLLRNCEFSRGASGVAVLGGRFIPATEDGFTTGSINGVTGGGVGTPGGDEDVIVAGVDLRSIKGRAWAPTALAAATAGSPNPSYRRLVFAGNLCERIGADPQPLFSLGESERATMSYNIIEGNTFVGDRANLFYSDPVPANATEADTLLNQAYGNRIANNLFDWAPTKHDAFADPETAAARGGGATGYRPHMIETWSIIYGVGWEGNVDLGRLGGGNFAFEYFGRRGLEIVAGSAGYTDDRSLMGSGMGGGSYRPGAASVAAGRGRRTSIDCDRTGALRGATFAAGANEPPATLAVSMGPASARSASRAGRPTVGWRATLAPARARSTQRAARPAVGWRATLAPARATSTQRAASPVTGWRGTVSPAAAHYRIGGASPLIGSTGVALAPSAARHRLRDIGVAVLPDLLFATPRLVRIEGEVRVQIVNP